MGRFPWWHDARNVETDNYPYDDPNVARRDCVNCGHKFRSGEERSVELATGKQICDKCQYAAGANQGVQRGLHDAPIEDRMQLSQMKAMYGIDTVHATIREKDSYEEKKRMEGDEYVGEKIRHGKGSAEQPFLREMFMSSTNAPPEWLQKKREQKREEEERSHDTLKGRRRRAAYSRTHGTMPRGTPE